MKDEEINAIQNAYSYARVSSKRQLSGSGIERQQLSRPAAICKAHGWILAKETFADFGVSAFHGVNRLKGDLATFIQLARERKLLPNAVLILEAWDRFSRQDLDESFDAVRDLLKTGVAIHISFGNQTFTKASLKELADRIAIEVALKAAYDYSANLSKRVKEAKQKTLARLKAGDIVPHNNVPKYVSFVPQTKTYKHNANTPLVQRMVKDFLAGNSLYSIAKRFNKEGVKTFRRGFQWSAKSCKVILQNRLLLGEFLGNKSFCDPIIDKKDFERVQAMLAKNDWIVSGRDNKNLANIFRGLAVCSGCGKRMHFNNQIVTLSTGEKAEYRYIRCPAHSTGQICPNRQYVNAQDVEIEFFVEFLMKSPEGLIHVNDGEANRIQKEIDGKRIQKTKVDEQIEKLAEANEHLNLEELKTRLTKLKKEQDRLLADIDNASQQLRQVQGAPVDFADLKKIVGVWRKRPVYQDEMDQYDAAAKHVIASLQDNAIRKKIRTLLPSQFGRIKIYTQAGSSGAFEVLNRQGKVMYRSLMFDV